MKPPLRLRYGLVLLLLPAALSACTPRLSLPFRDYETPSGAEDPEVLRRVESALEEAGWETADAPVENTIRTERRTMREWGLYRVTAYVEVVPLGGDYVRVFFHPYREFITGGQGKIPYLARSLRSDLIRPLDEALEEQGLYHPGLRPNEKLEEEIR